MLKNEELLLKKLKEKWMWISQKEFKAETDSFKEHYINNKTENKPTQDYSLRLWDTKRRRK